MLSFLKSELLEMPNPTPEKSFGKVVVTGENTGCVDTACALLIVPKGGFVPKHYHKSREVWLFMLKGEVNQTVGDASRALAAGDLVFIEPNAVHGTENTGAEEARFVEVWTTPAIDPDFYLP